VGLVVPGCSLDLLVVFSFVVAKQVLSLRFPSFLHTTRVTPRTSIH